MLSPVEGSAAKRPSIRVGTLDAELEPLILSKAAQHGLDPSWVTLLAKLDPQRRQVSLAALKADACIARMSVLQCVV